MGVVGRALDGVLRLRAARAAGRLAWRAHLLVPSAADAMVLSSREVARVYSGRGHHADAAAVLGVAERAAATPEARAQLAAARALAQLDDGTVPDDLEVVLEATLAEADRHLDAGEVRACGARLTDALALAFHPCRHFGDGPSPLLVDHRAFLAPFDRSSAMTALTEDPRPPRHRPRDARTRRLLVLAYDNTTFVNPLVEEYRANGVDVRVVDLAAEPGLPEQMTLRGLVDARLRYGLDGSRLPLPEQLADDVAWADTVFVEWGHRALVWCSLVRGIEAPVVARVQRYEPMTAMPTLTAWSGIERVVFVAPTIRDVVCETVPGLRAAGTRVHVVPYRTELAPYRRPKLPEADRTMALVGWNKMVKDPAWALDVLAALREAEPGWRLLLVGETTPSDSLEVSHEYHEALARRVVKLKDAVEVTGFRADVPDVLRRVGVILSASRMEASHEALLEGVASGALPVVRNWPGMRGWGGPAALYPDSWVVDSPEQAAARILAASPHVVGSDAALQAQEWVMGQLDWEVVRPALDAVMLDP